MAASWLLTWAPFKIDALGLVTILGADEMNRKLGRLCVSRVTEFLPMVASYVIADGSFLSAVPGFTIYNITDGIYATDVVGWFSRWLLCQKLTYNTTTLTVGVLPSLSSAGISLRGAVILGLVVYSSMILLAALTTDWWGLANAISLAMSAVARFRILKANRDAIDTAAGNAARQSNIVVKTFWKLPDGSCLALYTTRGVLTECLLTSPKPTQPKAYALYVALAWVGFLIHVISLGMASLPSQLLCVGILTSSTISAVMRVGSDDELVGTRIQMRRIDQIRHGGSMAATFARLLLSEQEEECMIHWKIMPLPKNRVWWEKYRHFSAQNTLTAFENWKTKETWVEFENRIRATAC